MKNFRAAGVSNAKTATSAMPWGAGLKRARAWIALFATLICVLALGAWLLLRSHERITQEQQGLLRIQASVVTENMDRQLHSVDNALRAARTGLGGQGKDAKILSQQQLKTLTDVMPGVRGILLTDAEGKADLAEKPALVGQDFSHRDYFSIPKERPDFTMLYVSSPFLSSAGNFSINMTKAIPDAQGRFNGVATANLDPSYFEIMARSVLHAPDMRVSLIHGKGRIFVDARHTTALLGADVATPDSLFDRHIRSERDESVMLGDDGTGGGARMIVYRTVLPSDLAMDTPLVVAVSRDIAAVYAVWWHDAWAYAMLFAVLCAASSATLYFAQQRVATVQRASREKAASVALNAARLAAAADLQQRTGKLAKVGGWQLELSSMRMDWTEEMHAVHRVPTSIQPDLALALSTFMPETRAELGKAINAAIQDGNPWSIEAQIATDDGCEVWVLMQGEAILEGGKIVRLVGASQDVTERVLFAAQLAQANAQLRHLSATDELTGVGNRRRFEQELEAEWSRARRQGLPLGLLMMDIDHFKRYNDHYGHPGGDTVLRRVAAVLGEGAQRAGEMVARYGGEEFAILLPGSDLAATHATALNILAMLANAGIPHAASPTSAQITMSIGVASLVPEAGIPAIELVQTADIALYAAKTKGRNRVEQPMIQSANDHVAVIAA